MANKKTSLDENAYIYQRRDEKSEKEKFKEMTLKEKWIHFVEYYLVKVLIGLAATAGLVYLLYSIIAPKPETVLHIVTINNFLNEETATSLEEEISEYLNLGDREEVTIDYNYFMDFSPIGEEDTTETTEEEFTFNPNFALQSSNTATSHMRLTAYIAAQEIDIIIAPMGLFEQFMAADYFDNLEDILPTDIFAALSDKLYKGTTQENTSTKPYGIVLDELPGYKLSNNEEPRVLGIVVNSLHKDNSISYIRYLLEE
ncbi:MAG: hypothetical protein GX323_04055 [Clostridiales bacterium]|nr:hypothetical protein [Clostridiales bacterium]